MKLDGIYNALNDVAPIKLSFELCEKVKLYDNSGIIIPVSNEITGVVFSLDLSNSAVDFAIQNKCNLIVTHHPAIYNPIKTLSGALLRSAQNNIGVISMHLNFDCAERGNDYYFSQGICSGDNIIITKLSSGGYGRIYPINMKLKDIKSKIEKEFNTKTLAVYGDAERVIKTAASFCGAGLEESHLDIDVDLFISADIKHHIILAALEKGKTVIAMTHYDSENYGFKRFYETLKSNQLKNEKLYYHNDERFSC